MTGGAHQIVTVRPFCGDCGTARTGRYCTVCCYPICDQCSPKHDPGGR